MTVDTNARSKALAPRTIKTRFVNVRSVLCTATRDKLLVSDPNEAIRLPRQRKREASMTILTPAEVARLLAAADERFVGFIAVCAFAGLRLGGAAALQVGDVDFLKRQVHVRRQVQHAAGGTVELRLPKYRSERSAPVPGELLKILAAHVELGLRGEWLFARGEDDPPHQNTIGHRWRTLLAKAGL